MNSITWAKIDGYPNYEVSDDGRIRSLDYQHTGKTHELSQKIDREGYKQVTIFNNGKRAHCLVHRLVAQVFIPNPENLPEVNHIDECKQNNAVDNLEWCTRVYNANYGTGMVRQAASERKTMRQKFGKRIYCPTNMQHYGSIAECAEKLGLHRSGVSRVLSGQQKATKGYMFEMEVINAI